MAECLFLPCAPIGAVSVILSKVQTESPWHVYVLLAMGLLALTAFVRQWQLTGRAHRPLFAQRGH